MLFFVQFSFRFIPSPLSILFCVCALLALTPQFASASGGAEVEVVPGEYVVAYRNNHAHSRALAHGEDLFGGLASTADTRVRNNKLRTLVRSNLPVRRNSMGQADTSYDPQAAQDFCDALRAAAQVGPGELICEPNFVVRVNALPSDYSAELYGLDRIQAPQAWNTTTGSDVIVAVLDTGIDYNHPDLAANMWTNSAEIPGNGIDDDGNGFIDDVYGVDFAHGDGDPFDDHGHGTHVAGTIGAVGNNGLGVVGVNWRVKLMALKFLTASGSGTTFFVPDAIGYAIDNGAKVINASFGGRGDSTFLRQAIAEAEQAGVLFVAAAGNFATDNDVVPHYPSNYQYSNVLSVAATDKDDKLGWFSNYGKNTVHLAAPGVQILSTLPNGRYGKLSGTSMAAPHVAGAAALVLARFPHYSGQQVKDSLLNSVNLLHSVKNKTVTGGRLNVIQALGENPYPIAPEGQVKISQFGRNRKGNRPLQVLRRAFATVTGTPGVVFNPSLQFEGAVDGSCELPSHVIPESGTARLRLRRFITRSSIFRFSKRVTLSIGSEGESRRVRAQPKSGRKRNQRVKQRRLRALAKQDSELLQQKKERSCETLLRQVSWRNLRS